MKLFYTRYPNFGDIINPLLFECLTGQPCVFASRFKAKWIGIGSLLDVFTERSWRYSIKGLLAGEARVWGSGFLRKEIGEERFFRKMNVLALRGKISLERAEKILGRKISVPLGDGGLLFHMLLEGKRRDRKYALGLVPHFVDFYNPVFEKISGEIPNSVIINVQDHPLKTLEQIASCDAILSTSLHGLVAADALGIPNKWMRVSDKLFGGIYKFMDYYSAFDIEDPLPIDGKEALCLDRKKVERIMEEYPIRKDRVEKIQEELLGALRKGLCS